MNIPFFLVRFFVFVVGLTSYWMEVTSDWLIGARRRTEYVRQGGCQRCGRCCRCLALVLHEGFSRCHWLVRLLGVWHRVGMNFCFIAEEGNCLIYRCGYLHEREGAPPHCSIYPFRHRLCRFFPRQGLYGRPSLHPECGFKFVRRDILEKRREAEKLGRPSFDDILDCHSRVDIMLSSLRS